VRPPVASNEVEPSRPAGGSPAERCRSWTGVVSSWPVSSRGPEPDFPTVPAVSADASDPGSLVRSGSVTAKLARNWWGVVECAAQVMRGVTGLGQRGGGPNNDPLRNDNDQGSEGRRWSCGRPDCGSPCGTSPAFNLKFRHARRTGWATMLPSQRMTVASRSSRTASAGCIPAIFALMASACDRIPAASAPGPKTRQSRRGVDLPGASAIPAPEATSAAALYGCRCPAAKRAAVARSTTHPACAGPDMRDNGCAVRQNQRLRQIRRDQHA